MYPGQTAPAWTQRGRLRRPALGCPPSPLPPGAGCGRRRQRGGAVAGLMAEALPDGTPLQANGADAAMPWALRPKHGAAGHLARREPPCAGARGGAATDSQAKASFQAQAGSADSAGRASGGRPDEGLPRRRLAFLTGAYALPVRGEAETLSRRWRVRSGSLARAVSGGGRPPNPAQRFIIPEAAPARRRRSACWPSEGEARPAGAMHGLWRGEGRHGMPCPGWRPHVWLCPQAQSASVVSGQTLNFGFRIPDFKIENSVFESGVSSPVPGHARIRIRVSVCAYPYARIQAHARERGIPLRPGLQS